VFLILILFVYFLFIFVFDPRVERSEVKILKCFYFFFYQYYIWIIKYNRDTK